jgi:hypothetical protein
MIDSFVQAGLLHYADLTYLGEGQVAALAGVGKERGADMVRFAAKAAALVERQGNTSTGIG